MPDPDYLNDCIDKLDALTEKQAATIAAQAERIAELLDEVARTDDYAQQAIIDRNEAHEKLRKASADMRWINGEHNQQAQACREWMAECAETQRPLLIEKAWRAAQLAFRQRAADLFAQAPHIAAAIEALEPE